MTRTTIRTAAAAITGATALLLAGCATTGRTDAADTGFHGGETAAMAATFRYLFANNASALQRDAATYCIGTGTPPGLNNPNPELIDALADVRPSVSPASACRRGDRVVDAGGRPALIFNLRSLECDGGNCLFEGGYYEANLSASSGRYRARWIDGAWQVTPEGPQAVS